MNRFRLQAWLVGAAALLVLALPARGSLITNGSFTSFTGTATNPFVDGVVGGQQLTGWTGSVAGQASGSYPGLVCVEASAATNPFCGYAKFAYNPGASPDGGNYVMFDADPNNTAKISQTVNGLIVGQKYYLTFYQAATYQATTGGTTYTGATNLNFNVTLGSQTISAPSPNPTTNTGAWQLVTLLFTANATSETLTFAAIGPTGGPPVLLLDGVNLVATTPEPATWMMMALGGLFVVVGKIRMSRKKPTAE